MNGQWSSSERITLRRTSLWHLPSLRRPKKRFEHNRDPGYTQDSAVLSYWHEPETVFNVAGLKHF